MGHETGRNINTENVQIIELYTSSANMPKIGHGAWVEDVWKSGTM